MLFEKPVPIEAVALTRALKQAVPTVEGVTVTAGGVEIRPLTKAFTVAEEQLLTTLLTAHDGAAALQAQREKAQLVKAEAAKQPSTLSLPERVRRIELCLGID